jgi:hypothetical protein
MDIKHDTMPKKEGNNKLLTDYICKTACPHTFWTPIDPVRDISSAIKLILLVGNFVEI